MKSKDLYKNIPLDQIPWIQEKPPKCLSESIKNLSTPPAKILDIGCGIGNFSLYFAILGFKVTGIDISPTAIEIAHKNALSEKLDCNFIVSDFLKEMKILKEYADFAFDYEVLHHIFPEDREQFVKNVDHCLKKGGCYLSICFSEEEVYFGDKGKYRTTPFGTTLYFSSEQEIKDLMSPYFNILELNTILIPGKQKEHQAIFCLMQKK